MSRPSRPVKVLSLGLPRTGSMSIMQALTRLGYQDVFHAVTLAGSPELMAFSERAADAHLASLPSFNGQTFTREQWDERYGPCEAITDDGAVFAQELIGMYPEAKVIVVRRDFDSWARSYDETLVQPLFGFLPWLSCTLAEPLLGLRFTMALRKYSLGFMGSSTYEGARHRGAMRKKYDGHHDMLRRLVPQENLLECELGDGWEPICRFLGKEVPEEPFPHTNGSAALTQIIRDVQISFVKYAFLTRILPAAVALTAVSLGVVKKLRL